MIFTLNGSLSCSVLTTEMVLALPLGNDLMHDGNIRSKSLPVDLYQLQSADTCTVAMLFKGCVFLSYTAAEKETFVFVAVDQQIKASLAHLFHPRHTIADAYSSGEGAKYIYSFIY